MKNGWLTRLKEFKTLNDNWKKLPSDKMIKRKISITKKNLELLQLLANIQEKTIEEVANETINRTLQNSRNFVNNDNPTIHQEIKMTNEETLDENKTN